MDSEGSSCGLPGSDNQDSNEPAPPGTIPFGSKTSTPFHQTPKLLSSSKGVENAKKRLRAFSIQKKTPVTPVTPVKPLSTGNTTVLIGKLSSVREKPKIEDDPKKPPKPPKPGASRRNFQDSYTDLQKRTLSEIEDMKRKMELVDLGIPLGLICPSSVNDKAMPTKAMPPIKSFLAPHAPPPPRRTRLFKAKLDASKVDEIIREAKKAKAEGKEFKFDYQKVLPDYDNPFQRKKDDPNAQEEVVEKEEKYDHHYTAKVDRDRDRREKSKRKSDRFDNFRRHSDFRKDQRERYKEKRRERTREREKAKVDKREKSSDKGVDPESKETDVNLNDYLVCDSWSLDNDDKQSSPHVDEKVTKPPTPSKDSESKETETKDVTTKIEKEAYLKAVDSPNVTKKIEKLKPVIDSFKFEIDPNDEELLDMFDDDSKLEGYGNSKSKQSFEYNQDTNTSDSFADDIFLESVINEIKQEHMSDDDSQDKGLVEYDSPLSDYPRGQGTPELDDRMRLNTSQRSDYAESYRSTDSGCKSTESGYKSTESGYKSTESYKSTEREYKSSDSSERAYKSRDKSVDSGHKRVDRGFKSSERDYKGTENEYKDSERYKSRDSGSKSTDSGHKSTQSGDRIRESMYSAESHKQVEKEMDDVFEGKMSKETAESLDIWNFVLKICQPLLFRHDSNKCYKETRAPPALWWAERVDGCGCVRGRSVVLGELRGQRAEHVDRVYGRDQIPEEPTASERSWYPTAAAWPTGAGDLLLDREYQRFMQAVWPEAAASQSNTPERSETDDREGKRRKTKLSSEGWSQESEVEEDVQKSKKQKLEQREKEKSRKRKRSSSTMSTTTDDDDKRKRTKKKTKKKSKSKLLKRARVEKKLKKLKEKQKKKKKTKVERTSEEELEEPKKKKEKKLKKKQQKTKKNQKKKAKAKSSSSSSSSTSSSDSEDRRRKNKKKKRQEDVFDLNILNNIKTEKLTDDEKCQSMKDDDFSPRRQQKKRHDIINVKELQNDFVGVQIKQEVMENDAVKMDDFDLGNSETNQSQEGSQASQEEVTAEKAVEREFKEPQDVNRLTPQVRAPADETNLSQCSSQESICSEVEQVQNDYEKDDSHLRPSSQNSNYSFNDVIASQTGIYAKGIEADCEKFDEYEQENYEMYEQLAMAYQSDVATNQVPLPPASESQRIETVSSRGRGEIKCDWRAGDGAPHKAPQRSRWGLKPNEVNIVLTGGSSEHFSNAVDSAVYQIESIANRNNDNSTGYDEAYMDTYGAQDMLQYGDCFAHAPAGPQASAGFQAPTVTPVAPSRPTLDARIHQALRHTALGDMATEPESLDPEADKENIDKGILVTKMGARGTKRVSFADGYKPGQDSDTEEPPLRKRKRPRRSGCAWPCPATHPDHVPLWDALPPPPPPPGSPPPPPRAAPPLHLLRPPRPLRAPPANKLDPNLPLGFLPPEPPPGLITFS